MRHSEWVNPEYVGITDVYSKKKKEKKMIDAQKHSLKNNLNYIAKIRDTLEHSLSRKKQELQWLKKIRERHLEDIRHKTEMEDKNNGLLYQLRMKSENAKKQNKKNRMDAMLSVKREKQRIKNDVMKQIADLKRIKMEHEREMSEYFNRRSKEKSEEKQAKKTKISNFYRKKNKLLLNSYRQMIKDAEMKTEKSKKDILTIQNTTKSLNESICLNQKKLQIIQNQILSFKRQNSKSKSVRWRSFEDSRVSKKSSKLIGIICESFSTDLTFKHHQ